MRGKHEIGKSESAKPGILRSLIEIVIIIAVAVSLAFLMTTFVVQPYVIPSGSMEETIGIGDRVFSEKIGYLGSTPQSGDIVTFKDPENPNRILIKRVIATGGQTVEMSDGRVFVDGVQLDEPYTKDKPSYPLNSDITYPFIVPEGEIWVMGDNRTNSSDSRFFGSVPIEDVTGRAFFRYWPLDRLGFI